MGLLLIVGDIFSGEQVKNFNEFMEIKLHLVEEKNNLKSLLSTFQIKQRETHTKVLS